MGRGLFVFHASTMNMKSPERVLACLWAGAVAKLVSVKLLVGHRPGPWTRLKLCHSSGSYGDLHCAMLCCACGDDDPSNDVLDL